MIFDYETLKTHVRGSLKAFDFSNDISINFKTFENYVGYGEKAYIEIIMLQVQANSAEQIQGTAEFKAIVDQARNNVHESFPKWDEAKITTAADRGMYLKAYFDSMNELIERHNLQYNVGTKHKL